MVLLVFTLQDALQRTGIALERNIGNKAQPPLIDAYQRYAVTGQQASDAQHGAIPPHDQAQIAVRADAKHVQNRMPRDVHMNRRLLLKAHVAALAVQELRNGFQGLARRCLRATGGSRVVLADQGDMAKMGPGA